MKYSSVQIYIVLSHIILMKENGKKTIHLFYLGRDFVYMNLTFFKPKKEFKMTCLEKQVLPMTDEKNQIFVFRAKHTCPEDTRELQLKYEINKRRFLQSNTSGGAHVDNNKSIVLDLFIGETYPQLTFTFSKDLTYVFLVQLESHLLGDNGDSLQLPPENQFLCFAYHILVNESTWSREDKIKAIADLVCHTDPSDASVDLNKMYKEVVEQLKKPENSLAALLLIGRLASGVPGDIKGTAYSVCKQVHENVVGALGELMDFPELLWKLSNNKELCERVKQLTYTGFSLVNYVLMSHGDDVEALGCWVKLSAVPSSFINILQVLFKVLTERKARLTESGYCCLEKLLTELRMDSKMKAGLFRSLLQCSPSLIHFLRKLIVVAASDRGGNKTAEDELSEAVTAYMAGCNPSFEDISVFIDMLQKGELRGSFKMLVLKNQMFKEMIDHSFRQENKASEADITPLIEIYIKNCTELVQSLKEKVEALLQPLLSSDNTKLSDLMARVGNRLDTSILIDFLHERIKQRFKNMPKDEAIRELARDVDDLRGNAVTNEYIQLTLKYFKSMYKNYRDLIALCIYLENFPEEAHRRQCYTFIFATIRDEVMERENGNFEPLRVIGDMMKAYRENAGVAGIFREACGYFDSTKAKAYEPARLVATFLDTLKTFIVNAVPAAIPNTVAAVTRFYDEIKEESVVLEVAENFRNVDHEKWQDLVTVFLIVKSKGKGSETNKEVEAVLKKFVEDIDEIQKSKELFKDFIGETDILSMGERTKLRKLYSDYYSNYTTKTIQQMKLGIPEDLLRLVRPLKDFYNYKKICSVRSLLAKELGSHVELGTFADRFDHALVDAKKKLKCFLLSIDMPPMETYEELFGECKNLEEEMRRLEEIMPQEKAKIGNLVKVQAAYEEKKTVLASIQHFLRVKDVLEIKRSEIYEKFQEYSARIGKAPIKEAVIMTKDVRRFMASTFGEFLPKILKIFLQLSEGKEMLLYLKSKTAEELSEMQSHITDYDDGILQRKTFDVMIMMLGYITEARAQTDQKGFTEVTLSFFWKQETNVEPLLLNSKLFLNKLDAFTRSTHEKAILHMEEIDRMLARSEFRFALAEGMWSLTIFLEEKHASQLSYEHLQELRERAIHSRNLDRIEAEKGAKKEERKKYDVFLELTDLLKNLMKTLKYIHDLAHPELAPMCSVKVENRDLSGMRALLKEKAEMSLKWENILVSAYEEFNVLTYFLPSQLSILEAYFINSFENQQSAVELLKFAGINVSHQGIPFDYYKPPGLHERITYLGKYVVNMIGYQVEPPLPTSSTLAYAVQDSNITEGILSIYTKHNCPLPQPNQLLFCHSRTKWEQVLSFAYRASKNLHKLFTIVHVENLSYELQQKLVRIVQAGIKSSNKVPIGFVVTTLESYVLQHFNTTGTLKLIGKTAWEDSEIKERLSKHMGEDYKNVRVYISDAAGIGKTSYVQETAKSEKIALHSFSIFGEISLDKILDRLERYDRKQPWFSQGIFFKLFAVNSIALLDELFFQILVLRCLQCGSRFVYLPTGCKIFVEIANTYNEELTAGFPFRRYFSWGRVGGLNIYECIDPDRLVYRHVLNYLKLLESHTINETDISFNKLLPISVGDSIILMNKYIFEGKSCTDMPLIQVSIFLKFLSKMLQNYEKSPLFRLTKEIIKRGASRQTIVEQLLLSCKRLTENSTHSKAKIESEQTGVKIEPLPAEEEDDEDSEASRAYAQHLEEQIVPFRDRKMMIVCFTETGKLIPLYDSLSNIPPEIQKLLKLVVGSMQDEEGEVAKGAEDINAVSKMNYKKMQHPEFVRFLRTTFNYPEMDPEDYVLTFDNFYKMIYIYLRAISGIPVVLMGETGCGKTRMIRFLCSKIMHSEPTIMNIHMGVTSEEIVEKVGTEVEKARANPAKRHFIFFDEFNTNENLGLITEIICDRVLESQPIPDNLLFFAACNPYKKSAQANVFDQVAGISKGRLMTAANKRLVYKVYQLPKTILEYVWDFGPLKYSDEEAYIRAIIGREKYTKSLTDKFAKMILIAHKFFREVDKQHVISLRDISRFLYLLKWFKEKGKRETDRAAELAFFFCYYYRISSEDSRKDLLAQVSSFRYGDSTGRKLRNVINEEAEFYTHNIELDKDIVWNNSLKECLFVMIICVLTKTPLLAVGKPGCSKSLSLKILEDHFKGKRSRIPFFQDYPEVVLYTLQGSLQCDSADVERIFTKARKEAASDPSLLPVVVIEEIGLCELSPRNPLKVLHKMLEVENIELTPSGVGFIGLSNWRLDAAKMNRALYLSRLPPTTAELEQTAGEIYKKLNGNKVQEEPLMKTLAQAYSAYQEQFGQTLSSDVFGLRDFYTLIKQVSCGLRGYTEIKAKYEMVKEAIKRNFSKVRSKNRYESLWRIFCKKDEVPMHDMIQAPHKVKLISESLDKIRDRQVLITGDSRILPIMVQLFLKETVEQMSLIVGSEYEKDQDSAEYTHMLLSRIIYSVEKGMPLMLSNLRGTHSHLYDLYNRNAAGETCRIMSVGTHFHPVCRIHKGFRCLVLMSYEDFLHEQPPLLNRLEKYYLSLDKLMTSDEKRLYSELSKWLNDIVELQESEEALALPQLFANLDSKEELVRILILSQNRRGRCIMENIKETCMTQLMQLATTDLLIRINGAKQNEGLRDRVVEMYRKQHEVPLKTELEKSAAEANGERLIYFTYSEKTVLVKELQEELKATVVSLGDIKGEAELSGEVQSFFTSPAQKLLIFAVSFPGEVKHLEHLHATIMRYQEFDRKKSVCILVFMKRNQAFENRPVIYMDGYNMKMPDTLDQSMEVLLEQLKARIKDVVRTEMDKSFEERFPVWLEEIFVALQSRRPGSPYPVFDGPNGSKMLIAKKIATNQNLVKVVQTKVNEALNAVSLNRTQEELKEKLCGAQSMRYLSLHQAARSIVQEEIKRYIYIVMSTIERYSALASFFTLEKPDDTDGKGRYIISNDVKRIWLVGFNKLTFDWTTNFAKPGSSRQPCFDGLKFPFALKIYEDMEKEFLKGGRCLDDPVALIREKYFYIGDQHAPLVRLLLEDFLSITACRQHVEVSSEAIHFLLDFIVFDEASMSSILSDFLKVFFKQQGFLRALMCFMGLCCEAQVKLEVLCSTAASDSVPPPSGRVSGTNKFYSKMKERGETLVGRLISQLIPSEELLGCFASKKLKYPAVLTKLYVYSFGISSNVREIANWNVLLFWLELAKYSMSRGEEDVPLTSVARKVSEISKDGMPVLKVMQSEEFLAYAFALASETGGKADENSLILQHKFKASIYRIMISAGSTKFLPAFLDEFNSETSGRFYMKALDDLCLRSKLYEQFDGQKCEKTAEIRLVMNSTLKIVENYLASNGVTCSFGCVLFYSLWKRIAGSKTACSFIKKPNIEKCMSEYMFSMDHAGCEYPSLLRLLSCLFLRRIMDTFADTPDSTTYTKAVNGLCNSSALSATLRLYLLRKLKDKPVDRSAKIKGLISRCTYMEATKESADLVLILPTDKEQMKHYGRLSQLMRHLKTVILGHDATALVQWTEYIGKEAGQGFYSFVVSLALCFINELYTTHMVKRPNCPLEVAVSRFLQEGKLREAITTSLGPNMCEFLTSLTMNFAGQSKLLTFNFEPLSFQHQFPLYPIAVSYVISIFLSAKYIFNPFTTCFYKDKALNENVCNVISSAYLFGMRDVKRGYTLHQLDSPTKSEGPKTPAKLTHRLLHFFLHSILYYLYFKHFISEVFEKADTGQNSEDYLMLHLEFDVNSICEIVGLGKHAGLACLIRLISEFATRLPMLLPGKDAQTEANKAAFEKQVLETVVSPVMANLGKVADQYTEELETFKESGYYITAAQLMNEEKMDPYYVCGEFFATLAAPTAEGLVKCLSEEGNKTQYPVACMLGLVDESILTRAKNLFPIISATNYFLEEYNYKLSEQKAKLEQIHSSKAGVRDMIEELVKAWKNAQFKEELTTYECKTIKNDPKFESSSYVKDFLLDPKQSSGQLLISGIAELTSVHNFIVTCFQRQMAVMLSHEEATHEALPVQSITGEDMVSLPHTYADLARFFYFHPSKNQKRVLHYDLEGLENWLMPQLIDKKALDSGNLETIRYQGSVNSEVPLLERLKKKRLDAPMEQYEVQDVMGFAEGYKAERNYEKVREVMTNLQCVMYYVENFVKDPKTKQNLKTFCEENFGEKSTLISFINDCPVFGKMEVSKLVHLYESLEIYWFDFLLEFVPAKFKCPERLEEITDYIQVFAKEAAKLHEDLVSELILAVKRFILRNLDEEFGETNELAAFIFKDELWTAAYRLHLPAIKIYFPKEIMVKDAAQVLEAVAKGVSEGKRKNTLTDSIVSDQGMDSRRQSQAQSDLNNYQSKELLFW